MKEFFKSVVGRMAQSRMGWSFCRGCGWLSDWLGRVYGHAKFVREVKRRDEKLLRIARELFPTLEVANGPFKGLRYPVAESYASMLLPKLLGSYESELHPTLERLFRNEYSAIVDIGCAEGYYATGLARKFEGAAVYAFDTSAEARGMCAEMATLNGVRHRIDIRDCCDEQALKSLPLGKRALIISDCEGYEKVLFNETVAKFLADHDVIVETHDFIDIDITPNMRRAFYGTHNIETIRSLDDIEKAHSYKYEELGPYTTRDRCDILGERRPGTMRWLVMTTRSSEKMAAVATRASA